MEILEPLPESALPPMKLVGADILPFQRRARVPTVSRQITVRCVLFFLLINGYAALLNWLEAALRHLA